MIDVAFDPKRDVNVTPNAFLFLLQKILFGIGESIDNSPEQGLMCLSPTSN